MAKKKDQSAADDLIKSLLDEMNGGESSELNDEEQSQSGEDESPFLGGAVSDEPTHEAPAGLDLKEKESTSLPTSAPLEVEEDPQQKVQLEAINQEQGKTAFRSSTEDRTYQLSSPLMSEYGALPTESIPDKMVMDPSRSGVDATLAQAESLRVAQQRILELEKEVDRWRQEGEEISSAAEIIKNRNEEMLIRIHDLERDKNEVQENAQSEIIILKGQLQFKESELAKALQKIEDLEIRLKNDFRKVRVRERELENRLELLKAEKSALIRSKDDSILELKRKVDQLEHEIDNYREKCLELNKTIESNKEQFKRTVRALKLALTNLEAKDAEAIPLKKAE